MSMNINMQAPCACVQRVHSTVIFYMYARIWNEPASWLMGVVCVCGVGRALCVMHAAAPPARARARGPMHDARHAICHAVWWRGGALRCALRSAIGHGASGSCQRRAVRAHVLCTSAAPLPIAYRTYAYARMHVCVRNLHNMYITYNLPRPATATGAFLIPRDERFNLPWLIVDR